MENLNKENFWNGAKKMFPLSVGKFCDWIDQYKEENKWTELFNQGVCSHTVTPKYHDLPLAMQIGIFFQWHQTEESKMLGEESSWKEAVESTKEFFIQVFEQFEQYYEENEEANVATNGSVPEREV